MISEERIKELAAIAGFGDDPDEDYRLNDVLVALRTVAAEAREEGVDEMRDAVKVKPILHRTNDYLDRKAEWLKERGCICVNEATSKNCPVHGLKDQGK